MRYNGNYVVSPLVLPNGEEISLAVGRLLTPGDGDRCLHLTFQPTASYINQTLSIPRNWTAEYSTNNGSTWSTTLPGNLTAITNIRACSQVLGAPEWLSPVSKSSSPALDLPAPRSELVSATGGDSWASIAYKNYIFAIFHPKTFVGVDCRDKRTGDKCVGYDPLSASKSQFAGYSTFVKARAVAAGGALYITATRNTDFMPGLLCVNVEESPPVLCKSGAFIQLSEVAAFKNAQISTFNNIGHSELVDGKFCIYHSTIRYMMCFDVEKRARCPDSPYSMTAYGTLAATNWDTRLHQFIIPFGDGKMFVMSEDAYLCYFTSNFTMCPGNWPVRRNIGYWLYPTDASYYYSPVVHMNTSGAIDGLCFMSAAGFGNAGGCLDLLGNNRSDYWNPFTIPGLGSGGDPYYGVFVNFKTRVFLFHPMVGVNPTPVYCFDYKTKSMCYNSTIAAPFIYRLTTDVLNPTCLIYTSDNGALGFLDAYSGKSYCSNPAIAVQASAFEPEVACSTTSAVVAWQEIKVTGYSGNGVPSDILLTVVSEDLNQVPGWIDIPVTINSSINMETLSVSTTGRNPSFVFQFVGVAGGNISGINVEMKYEGRGPEMCAKAKIDGSYAPAADQPRAVVRIKTFVVENMTAPTLENVETKMGDIVLTASGDGTACPKEVTFAKTPGPVGSLAATGSSTISLAFKVPTDEGDFSISGYEYALTGDGTNWKPLKVSIDGANNCAGTISGPLARVWIRAVNFVGGGTVSNATVV